MKPMLKKAAPKKTAKGIKPKAASDKKPAEANPRAIKWWFAVLSKEDSQAIWDKVGEGPLSVKVKTMIADAVMSARAHGRNQGYFLSWAGVPPAETFNAGTLVVRYHLPKKESPYVNMWLSARCEVSVRYGVKSKSWNMLNHIEEFKFNFNPA